MAFELSEFQEDLGRAVTQDTPVRITPGPFEVSPRVLEAARHAVIGHRTETFRRLMRENARMLLEAFQIEDTDIYFPVILPGTGTAAMEAMAAAIAPTHRPLVLVNGRFSRRLADIALTYNPKTCILDFGVGKTIDQEKVSQHLATDCSIGSVFFGLQDTREAILNDYRDLSRIVKQHGRLLCVDSISAMVCEDVRPGRLGFDFFVESSGKGIRSLPGLSVVCGRLDLLETLKSSSCSSYYLNLYSHFRSQKDCCEPLFADPISLHFAMHAALRELLNEGVDTRRGTIQRRTGFVRDRLFSRSLEFLRPLPTMPHSVTSVLLPEGLQFDAFQHKLRARGFLVYPGSSVEPNCFQIGTAGYLSDKILSYAMQAISDALAE